MKCKPFVVVPTVCIVVFLLVSEGWSVIWPAGSRTAQPTTGTAHHLRDDRIAVGGAQPLMPADPPLTHSGNGKPDASASSSVKMERNADPISAAVCPLRSNTHRELGTFPFWGKQMNASFPCPAAGMNNQLTLMLAFWHCFESLEKKKTLHKDGAPDLSLPRAGFRWKDVSCSPTGGKEGNRRFVVGSADYVYAWFRWSEAFRVLPAPRISPAENRSSVTTLCLHDSYSWKEHAELARCQSNIGHLYGRREWWDLRGRLLPHPRYRVLMQCIFETAASSSSPLSGGAAVDDATRSMHRSTFAECIQRAAKGDRGDAAAMESSSSNVLGIHVRRGDYAHFCKGLTGSSGIRKFRVPPYKWLAAASRSLSGRFPDTCAPSDALVLQHLRRLLDTPEAAVRTLFIASNSPAFVAAVRNGLAPTHPNVQVVSLPEALAALLQPSSASPGALEWPSELRTAAMAGGGGGDGQRDRAATVTTTDKVMLDIVGLAMSGFVVLNRYSTFSQSVVDERVLDGRLLDFVTLRGAQKVLWW